MLHGRRGYLAGIVGALSIGSNERGMTDNRRVPREYPLQTSGSRIILYGGMV